MGFQHRLWLFSLGGSGFFADLGQGLTGCGHKVALAALIGIRTHGGVGPEVVLDMAADDVPGDKPARNKVLLALVVGVRRIRRHFKSVEGLLQTHRLRE